MRLIVSFCTLLCLCVGVSSAQPVDQKPSFSLIGSWKITTDSGRPGDQVGIMSVQSDGRIAIAGTDRLRRQQTPASLTDAEAAQMYRRTIVLIGKYSVVRGWNDGIDKMIIEVDEASDPALMGQKLELQVKVHGPNRFAMGGAMENPILNNAWGRL